MNWRDKAVCSKDKHSDYWLSYNQDKIKYAKEGCSKCSVTLECFLNSLDSEEDVGVISGISEFERLVSRWKAVSDINGNNWQ